MNDGRNAVSNRGVLHAEASANTYSVNNATPPVPHKPTTPAKTRTTQSPKPKPLSLQIDGLNVVIPAPGEGNSNPAYIESSERGSDTSGDGRRLDLSASTVTDSLSSFPSSANGNSQSTEFGNSHTLNGHTSIPWVDPELLESQLAPHIQPVNGGASVDRWQPSLSPIKAGNVSISPPPSPKHSRTRSNFDARLAPGQKRTAAGDFKSTLDPPTAHSADANGAARQRSKSTGSSAHGSRIAQLSVHIRTRLSYAAAKVEQARQSREATPQTALRTRNMPLSPSDKASLPAGNSTHFLQDSQTSSNGNSRYFPSHNRSRSACSSNQFLPIPKLAPPVDIIASNGHNQRRRPNPNAISNPSNRSPISHHRRHHSHQENGLTPPLNGQAVLGPGTPSLSSSHTHAPPTPNAFYRLRTQSQNTLMEQDAIETLMFMSSPENSGYRFSPRPLQPTSTQSSQNESVHASSNGAHPDGSQGSQSSESHNGRGLERKPGLEAHAGDDIDRLLDQMDSDSDDEDRYASYRSGINGAHPFRGHQRPR
ncbi:hypothetical protein DTO013E5_4948 [Penicillium roqueforti]|uniref:Genomic scaffold, ProqFM164S03 n=1 Tax=Penicillium roqueforti (strain FM164) TaxID=1365484 RepID=W6QJP9_PENRF|nr:hypothetical protein DTO012A1_3487 [Penicillium roqueforti]CDM34439.1 unnamed protein product [Penicillium roqueforti FM164]KAI2755432.1 hypothetical protein DTO013F2_1115 [Penicillium roqueforti]KAI2770690.1 hypothetical protein DTO012A8_4433 [Penicillium roqueforti]KAI3076970.1 hypothetical protein CBS147339_4940 [Penicillium roqueforti]